MTDLERLRLAERISDWLDAIDLGDDQARTTLATSLADIVAAAGVAGALIEDMLAQRPLESAADADRALTAATDLNVRLVSELREHLNNLEQAWTALEDRLIELSPDDA